MTESERHRSDAKKLVQRAEELMVRAIGSAFLGDDHDLINRIKIALKALGREVAP